MTPPRIAGASAPCHGSAVEKISEPESDVPLQRILNRQDTAPAALGMRARSEKRMLDSPPGPGEMARPRGTRAPPPAVDAPAAVDKGRSHTAGAQQQPPERLKLVRLERLARLHQPREPSFPVARKHRILHHILTLVAGPGASGQQEKV